MTTTINIHVEDTRGVDMIWMFPGLIPIESNGVGYSTNGSEADVYYTAGGEDYKLECNGSNLSKASYGYDIKGVATSIALYKDESGDNVKLIDVDFALDDAVYEEYGGMPINSLIGLTNNSLGNFISAITDFQFNIYGNTGSDVLIGSGVIDFIDGAAGRDVLTGNQAGDTFFFGHFGRADWDRITDFQHDVDKIALDGNVLAGILPANLKRTFHDITDGGMKSVDANDRLLYDRTSGKLLYDPDGNAAHGARPEIVAILEGHAVLDRGDFQIFL